MKPHALQRQADLCLKFPSGELEVRNALCALTTRLREMALSADDVGSVELVLGEVLNNIVEHAYGAGGQGEIEILVKRAAHVLRFRVIDEGGALPQRALPEGRLPAMDGPLEAMPEGGFGWYLVRNLACDLDYRRADGRNELAFSICCEGQA